MDYIENRIVHFRLEIPKKKTVISFNILKKKILVITTLLLLSLKKLIIFGKKRNSKLIDLNNNTLFRFVIFSLIRLNFLNTYVINLFKCYLDVAITNRNFFTKVFKRSNYK